MEQCWMSETKPGSVASSSWVTVEAPLEQLSARCDLAEQKCQSTTRELKKTQRELLQSRYDNEQLCEQANAQNATKFCERRWHMPLNRLGTLASK